MANRARAGCGDRAHGPRAARVGVRAPEGVVRRQPDEAGSGGQRAGGADERVARAVAVVVEGVGDPVAVDVVVVVQVLGVGVGVVVGLVGAAVGVDVAVAGVPSQVGVHVGVDGVQAAVAVDVGVAAVRDAVAVDVQVAVVPDAVPVHVADAQAKGAPPLRLPAGAALDAAARLRPRGPLGRALAADLGLAPRLCLRRSLLRARHGRARVRGSLARQKSAGEHDCREQPDGLASKSGDGGHRASRSGCPGVSRSTVRRPSNMGPLAGRR